MGWAWLEKPNVVAVLDAIDLFLGYMVRVSQVVALVLVIYILTLMKSCTERLAAPESPQKQEQRYDYQTSSRLPSPARS